MDPPSLRANNFYCSVHNLPSNSYIIDNSKRIKYLCQNCSAGVANIKDIQQQQSFQSEIRNNLQNEIKNVGEILNLVLNELFQYKEKITQQIDKVLKLIEINKQKLDDKKQSIFIGFNEIKENFLLENTQKIFQDQINEIAYQTSLQLEEVSKNCQYSMTLNLKNRIDEKVKQIQKNHQQQPTHDSQESDKIQNMSIIQQDSISEHQKVDQIIQGQTPTNLPPEDSNSKFQEIDQIQNEAAEPVKVKKFYYQLVSQRKQQEKQNFASAFNHDSTLFAAGIGKLIQIFQFKNENLKNRQKYPQKLISTARNGNIFIWQSISQQQWNVVQSIQDHADEITCSKLSTNQDLLITGSDDKTIQFYKLHNNSFIKFQSYTCIEGVSSLDLNEQCNYLVVSGQIEVVLTFKNNENEWKLQQVIQTRLFGIRIGFIDQYQFILQPISQDVLYVYDLNQQNEQFYLQQAIQVQNEGSEHKYFPIQGVPSKCLFIVKHREFLNIIRKTSQSEFVINQTINFNSSFVFGTINHDGSYLITWDGKRLEFQVRKMVEQELKKK